MLDLSSKCLNYFAVLKFSKRPNLNSVTGRKFRVLLNISAYRWRMFLKIGDGISAGSHPYYGP
jgi:hypothetical protein